MGNKIVTFGEVMLRLSPPGFLRFSQAKTFDVTFGGGEANVAVSLANYGLPVEFVSRIPENDIGAACIAYLRQFGVGVSHILHGGERLGIYFLEIGSMQRGSKVIYDRAHSAIATIEPGMVDWHAVFSDADWFHWTGITPAISAGTAQVCLEALKVARELGLTISCDLNFRKKLWKWGKSPAEIMPELVSYTDIAIGNEEDAEKVFGIRAPESDVNAGNVEADQYRYVCQELAARFPNLKGIAITLRGSISASHNTWSGVFWQDSSFYQAPKYDITHIVDRVGGGDAFVAGLIYGLLTEKENPQKALDFAVAASCLKHSIFGDFNLVTREEVQKLVSGNVSGRVSR